MNAVINPCQAWREEAAELRRFWEPEAAAEETAVLDMAGGRGESQVAAVQRQLFEQFRASL
jgi:hypothetical protein